MNNEQFKDLITRLRNSVTPMHLREEVIQVLTQHRFFLEEVHMSAKQNGDRSAEHISGAALGKVGYSIGDANI